MNILSFLNTGTLSDYTAGVDMVNEAIIDAEDVLIAEKRKYLKIVPLLAKAVVKKLGELLETPYGAISSLAA